MNFYIKNCLEIVIEMNYKKKNKNSLDKLKLKWDSIFTLISNKKFSIKP